MRGAIMIFKSPGLRASVLWEPSAQECINIIGFWGKGPRPGKATLFLLAQGYKTADFIRGPISTWTKGPGNRPVYVSRPGRHSQLVASSYNGCQSLAQSLEYIIFIE
jgi:hypothetical protein